MRKFNPLLVNTHQLLMFGWVYPLIWLLQLVMLPLDWIEAEFWAQARLSYLFAMTGLYGWYRAYAFQPMVNVAYQRAISIMPINNGKQLPGGPVLLSWKDVIFIALLILLGMIDGKYAGVAGMITYGQACCFLVTYGFISFLGLGRIRWITAATLFLLPLLIFPVQSFHTILMVLLVIVLLQSLAIRQCLKSFPYDEPDWHRPPPEVMLERAREQEMFGFPLAQLGPVGKVSSVRLSVAMALSMLIGWWFTAAIGGIELTLEEQVNWAELASSISSSDWDASYFYIKIVWTLMWAIALLGRVFKYIWKYLPPIKARARLFRFPWIIPSYDKIFVAPILIAIWGLWGLQILNWLGCPDVLLLPSGVFVVWMLALSVGPKFETWQLTGNHRIWDGVTLSGGAKASSSSQANTLTIRFKLD